MSQHFDWDLTHKVLFLYIFPSHHMNLRDQHDWKMLIRWCRTDICSCKISPKVFLTLDNLFIVKDFSTQHNIKISIKTARVSRLSVSYDYDLNNKMIMSIWRLPLRPGEQVTFYLLLMLYDYICNNMHELCSLYFCGSLIFVFKLRKCALFESSLWCMFL